MDIQRITAWQLDLPLHEGSYKWSGGKSVEVFDSTVVRVETAGGNVGWGEVCPLGPAYLPSYAAGARAGLAELAPDLLGEPATELTRLNRRMDALLKGHPYAKSAIDMACWDVLGKVAGLPCCDLLGGRYGESVALYRAISQDAPEVMAERVAGYRAEGYRRFQLKVGGDPDVDISRIRAAALVLETGDKLIADANTGWLMHEAARVVRAVRDVDVYIEQPCETYEQCLAIRRRTDPGAAGARPVRRARPGHDHRGFLGRGRDHSRDQPPRPLDPRGLPLHRDRLQQLRHPRLRGRRTAA